MSTAALFAALSLELRCVEKMVLVALANRADDAKDNTAWPSMETIAAESGLSIRAARQAIGALEAAGHISRQERPGKGVIYWVHPGRICRGADDAPRQDMPPQTPAPHAATPAPRADNPTKNPLPPEPKGSAPKGAAPMQEKRDRLRKQGAGRLPPNWRPAELPADLAERVRRAGEDWHAAELVKFQNWAAAESGPKAFAADWHPRWQNWLLRGLEKLPALSSPTVAPVTDPEPVGDGGDGYRKALPAGLRSIAEIRIEDGRPVHIVKTEFALELLTNQHGDALKLASQKEGFRLPPIVRLQQSRQAATVR